MDSYLSQRYIYVNDRKEVKWFLNTTLYSVFPKRYPLHPHASSQSKEITDHFEIFCQNERK